MVAKQVGVSAVLCKIETKGNVITVLLRGKRSDVTRIRRRRNVLERSAHDVGDLFLRLITNDRWITARSRFVGGRQSRLITTDGRWLNVRRGRFPMSRIVRCQWHRSPCTFNFHLSTDVRSVRFDHPGATNHHDAFR